MVLIVEQRTSRCNNDHGRVSSCLFAMMVCTACFLALLSLVHFIDNENTLHSFTFAGLSEDDMKEKMDSTSKDNVKEGKIDSTSKEDMKEGKMDNNVEKPKFCFSGSPNPSKEFPYDSSTFRKFSGDALIINELPHDSTSFTEGLFLTDDGRLFESRGLNGQSKLCEVNLETGKAISEFVLSSQYFGEGIVQWKDQIFMLTWRSNTGFILDFPKEKGQSFEEKGTFTFHTTRSQGWGMTTDGEHIIVSDGSSYIHFWDPSTIVKDGNVKEVKKIQVKRNNIPITQLNELEYVCGEILANVWHQENILRINPETGNVIGEYDFTGLYQHARESTLNGIAYDKTRGVLLLTGKRWDYLYEVITPDFPFSKNLL
eukprot:g6234.t1